MGRVPVDGPLPVKRVLLIRWPFAAGFFALGASMAYVALSALIHGRPDNALLRAISIVAIGVVPASVIFAVPTFGLGVFLVMFRRARHSGTMLTAYCGAYLGGVIAGALAFAATL